MFIRKLLIPVALAVCAAAIAPVASAATATTFAATQVDPALVTPVSGGCGPYGWRGPWGHCRYNAPPPPWGAPRWNGCPPGYWHGPWGQCRNTPYHGRLPGGGWK